MGLKRCLQLPGNMCMSIWHSAGCRNCDLTRAGLIGHLGQVWKQVVKSWFYWVVFVSQITTQPRLQWRCWTKWDSRDKLVGALHSKSRMKGSTDSFLNHLPSGKCEYDGWLLLEAIPQKTYHDFRIIQDNYLFICHPKKRPNMKTVWPVGSCGLDSG